MDIFHISEMPENGLITNPEITRVKNGTQIQAKCPVCNKIRWINNYNLKNGHTKSSYCYDHRWVNQIKWATPEEFSHRENIIIDFKEQRIREIGKTTPKGKTKLTRNVEVFVQCPDCKEQRWTLVNGLRNNNLTTLCTRCAAKRSTPKGKNTPNWNGGIQTTVYGYTFIHKEIVIERYGQETYKYIKEHLKDHNNYYYEHRIVALLHYGPEAVKPGQVIRHFNGNKQDNRPENLKIGTQKDNIRDHVTDRRELKKWRGIALTLARLLVLQNSIK